jgi:two-component system cell cycle response regulator
MADVLLIEDNRDSLELMAYLLRAFGHKPLSVASAEAAFGALEYHLPDLIVCDLGLPRITGVELVREIKRARSLKKIPVVAVTGEITDRQKVLAAGFDGYFPKPIKPETFVDEIMLFLKPELWGAAAPTPSLEAPAAPAASPVAQGGHTILAVDDRPANLQLTRSVLEPFGYQVLTATGVQDGLALARKALPDRLRSDQDHEGRSNNTRNPVHCDKRHLFGPRSQRTGIGPE